MSGIQSEISRPKKWEKKLHIKSKNKNKTINQNWLSADTDDGISRPEH